MTVAVLGGQSTMTVTVVRISAIEHLPVVKSSVHRQRLQTLR